MILASLRYKSHCWTWVPVFRMRPYKSRSRVSVGVGRIYSLIPSLLKALSANHRPNLQLCHWQWWHPPDSWKIACVAIKQTNKQKSTFYLLQYFPLNRLPYLNQMILKSHELQKKESRNNQIDHVYIYLSTWKCKHKNSAVCKQNNLKICLSLNYKLSQCQLQIIKNNYIQTVYDSTTLVTAKVWGGQSKIF